MNVRHLRTFVPHLGTLKLAFKAESDRLASHEGTSLERQRAAVHHRSKSLLVGMHAVWIRSKVLHAVLLMVSPAHLLAELLVFGMIRLALLQACSNTGPAMTVRTSRISCWM